MTPERTDREVLRERLGRLIFGRPSYRAADAILDAKGVGVFDPATHVAVDVRCPTCEGDGLGDCERSECDMTCPVKCPACRGSGRWDMVVVDRDLWEAVKPQDVETFVAEVRSKVSVPRDLLRRMAAVCTYGGPFTDDEAEQIERWSE